LPTCFWETGLSKQEEEKDKEEVEKIIFLNNYSFSSISFIPIVAESAANRQC
jgi:hypothetical protein